MSRAPVCALGVFVVGANAGVGKTLVAAALARLARRRGQRVGVFKPFLCGDPHAHGAGVLARAAGLAGPGPLPETLLDMIAPHRFDAPGAPGIGARRLRRRVDLDALVEDARALGNANDFLVVAGTGGLALPVTESLDRTSLDLLARTGLPALLVADTAAGAVSHVALAVAALRERNIACRAIVLSQVDPGHEQEDPLVSDAVQALTGIRPAATLPYVNGSEAIRVGSAARTLDEAGVFAAVSSPEAAPA